MAEKNTGMPLILTGRIDVSYNQTANEFVVEGNVPTPPEVGPMRVQVAFYQDATVQLLEHLRRLIAHLDEDGSEGSKRADLQ